eukprot:TRINITY_DN3378_c0_g1_i1.p2 TRINITY_DN3378_c0_g1~~TRINITY_DN3378_c0_g1_i1.p2  ORF type:complete len:227 (-),score=33.24 TRINITY_DN3378_c0_g1_i1:1170-1850(-)
MQVNTFIQPAFAWAHKHSGLLAVEFCTSGMPLRSLTTSTGIRCEPGGGKLRIHQRNQSNNSRMLPSKATTATLGELVAVLLYMSRVHNSDSLFANAAHIIQQLHPAFIRYAASISPPTQCELSGGGVQSLAALGFYDCALEQVLSEGLQPEVALKHDDTRVSNYYSLFASAYRRKIRRDTFGSNFDRGVLQVLWDGGLCGQTKVDVVHAGNLNRQQSAVVFPQVEK